MINLKILHTEFFNHYGKPENQPEIFFAPGRVNLIGEHTDYNGGFVLPCALQYGTCLLIRKTDDKRMRMTSGNFPEKLDMPVTEPIEPQQGKWFNYPLGVMFQFVKKGIALSGMELLFAGDIPNSAGLSSSASIEMVTAFAMNDLYGAELKLIDLVKLSQTAEHEFPKVNCGIMDQFAVGLGEKNHAVFLNCRTLEYKLIPVLLPGYRLIIVNSNKNRGLADSKYNERVAECQLAVTYLSKYFDISNLSELGYPQFYKAQDKIPDETVRKRARHVISENQRVLNSVSCLLKSDLIQFGSLMNASHDSLRENYEVTGFELDTLVEEARLVNGVLGARMTGAGFGGCTVNLVMEEVTDHFIQSVGEGYNRKIGLTADFYIADVSDGVKKIK